MRGLVTEEILLLTHLLTGFDPSSNVKGKQICSEILGLMFLPDNIYAHLKDAYGNRYLINKLKTAV